MVTPLTSSERTRWLDAHIPYRIQILRGLEIYSQNGGPAGLMRPVFPSVYEACLVACRWASNLLGLYLDNKTYDLKHRSKPPDETDVLSTDLGGLLVDINALSHANRTILARVLRGANKASAHPVREGEHAMSVGDVDEAARLLLSLIKTHIYDRVGYANVPAWQG